MDSQKEMRWSYPRGEGTNQGEKAINSVLRSKNQKQCAPTTA